MYIPDTPWTKAFAGITITVCFINCILETFVFAVVQHDLEHTARQVPAGHILPTFFALFALSFGYELYLCYDGLRQRRMMQIVGLCIYNCVLLAYACFQPGYIHRALDSLDESRTMLDEPLLKPGAMTWERTRGCMYALAGCQALGFALLCGVAYRLRSEFAWHQYQLVQAADPMTQRRLRHFQIYVTLLKFDFFFLIGFLTQAVSTTPIPASPEFGVPLGGIFMALFLFWMAAESVAREHKSGTAVVLFLYFATVVYLGWKGASLMQQGFKIMAIFCVMNVLLMICTIIMAIICTINFGRGLRSYTRPKQSSQEDLILQGAPPSPYPEMPQRMILD